MKLYSYAFGNHSAFLRVDRPPHPSLKLAFQAPEHGSLIYVYDKDTLVTVFELQPLLEEIFRRFYRHYMPGTPIRRADMDFNLAERYIAKLIRRRVKEQV